MMNVIAREAARDGEAVCRFLDRLGIKATPGKTIPISAKFLVHLAAGLRLLYWDQRGFQFHRDAGLPDGRQTVNDAFRLYRDLDHDPTPLLNAVVGLYVDRLAWHGPSELGTDVVLDEPDEDMLLDSLADFLWENRTREGPGRENT
jgi:hypothetical protein